MTRWLGVHFDCAPENIGKADLKLLHIFMSIREAVIRRSASGQCKIVILEYTIFTFRFDTL